MDSTEEAAPFPQTEVTCDYLIVGAGTACLAFVDTLVTLREDATFVIVDRNSGPGGHWTSAYSFVTLHQQSCCYGVRSLPLGKLDKNGKEVWDIHDRATGKEICEYYERVTENLKATGRVQTYFGANYEGESTGVSDSNANSNNYKDATAKITHIITTKDGRSINVKCTKVVQSESNVIVPSMRKGVPFPIDESVVRTISLNELPKHIGNNQQKYLVIGAGKSGIDAISYLLDCAKVHPDQITWIVSQSAWYWQIEAMVSKNPKPGKKFWKFLCDCFFDPLLKAKSADEAFLIMEEVAVMGRVDPDDEHFPRIFRGASLKISDMANLRSLQNVVKDKGRVTSITSNEVVFQDGAHSIPYSPSDTLVVDCMTADTYGYFSFEKDFKFFNPHKIRLGPQISVFNPSHTSTQVAFLEAEFSDSAAGDAAKNSFCYFVCSHELEALTPMQEFLLIYYCEIKTNDQFSNYLPYSKFVLGDRTDLLQPDHHGGILGLLWNAFGPNKMKSKADMYRKRIENGSYKDFPTHPMSGRSNVDFKNLDAVKRIKPKTASAFCCKNADAIDSKLHSILL